MTLNRRSLLKGIAAAGAATAGGAAPAAAKRERRVAPDDAVGMLYDTTRCIGCKACVVACKEANGLPPSSNSPASGDGLWDAAMDLDGYTKNIIKLFKEGDHRSYVKRQCMHCIDPACVGACMMGSYQKREFGIVTWDPSKCIGCRYCQVVCPFNIPKFQWDTPIPKVVKCEMCNHLLAEGKIPACCDVCPREAVIYGKYTDLLEDARQRLADYPDRYVNKIYGENDLGGTQVLYLSHVPFEDIGFDQDDEEAVPHLQQTIQHGTYQGFIAPAVLYAILGGVMWRNRKNEQKEGQE